MIGKQKIERMCRKAGMKPVRRANYEGAEIFIADGLSVAPHFNYRRFEVWPGEHAEKFPGGMYVTLWWVSRGEDKLDAGRPLFFDLFHNPEYANGSKQLARIKSAMSDARSFLDGRKRAAA